LDGLIILVYGGITYKVRVGDLIGAGSVSQFSAGATGLTPEEPETGAVELGGVLNAAHGGTGQGSYAPGDLLYASAADALQRLPAPTSNNPHYLHIDESGLPHWSEVAYGAFQNNNSVTLATANTPTLIPINYTDYARGMSYASGDGIYVSVAGLYNYQFSIQFANTDTQIHSAVVWLRKNGVDVPGTASKFDIIARHGGSDGYVIGACNFYVDLEVGSHVELWWACDSTSVYLEAYPVQTSPYPRPSIPSVVATLTYVSPY
jgi:hypothetical protein